jgi:hypothetical protein
MALDLAAAAGLVCFVWILVADADQRTTNAVTAVACTSVICATAVHVAYMWRR